MNESGNPRIDAAMAHLSRLEAAPIESHQEIFDEVHAGLRDALAHAGRVEGDTPRQ